MEVKGISLVLLTFAMVAVSARSAQAVSREELALRVDRVAEAVLLGQLPKTQRSDKAAVTRTVGRAQLLAHTITNLQEREIDEELAEWIIDSFRCLLSAPECDVSADTPVARTLLAQILDRCEKRFKTLTNARGEVLLGMRAAFQQSSRSFHAAFEEYLLDRLSRVSAFKIEALYLDGGHPAPGSGFEQIVLAGLGGGNFDGRTDQEWNCADFRDDHLESALLTLALVRDLQLCLTVMRREYEIEEGCILGGEYDDGDPFHILSLKPVPVTAAERQKLLEPLIADVMVPDKGDGVWQIEPRWFRIMMIQAEKTHLGAVKTSPLTGAPPDFHIPSVLFANVPDFWKRCTASGENAQP